MKIADEDIDALIADYKEDTGVEISADEAREMAVRVLSLWKIICQPIPSNARPTPPIDPVTPTCTYEQPP